MKKTLERLKIDASEKARQLNDFIVSLRKILEKQSSWDSKSTTIAELARSSTDTMVSLLRYVQALEDYGYELDEEWDKLLKSIKDAQESTPRPTQKIEKGKKTSYVA